MTLPFLDSRELDSLRADPDLSLIWKVLVHHLRLVGDLEGIATVSDARGYILQANGNTKVRDEAYHHGLRPGARWTEMGTNAIRLVTECLLKSAQIYGPEHWMHFQSRWACTAAGIFDPYTHHLIAVINVTDAWKSGARPVCAGTLTGARVARPAAVARRRPASHPGHARSDQSGSATTSSSMCRQLYRTRRHRGERKRSTHT